MKVFSLLALLALVALAGPVDQNGNPLPPTLISVVRDKSKANVTWDYPTSGDPDAFQLMRRTGETFSTIVIGIHRLEKRTVAAAPGMTRYTYGDKKLDPQTTYTYTLIVFTPDGTSLASQPLVSTP